MIAYYVNYNVVGVALANKLAREAWAVLARGVSGGKSTKRKWLPMDGRAYNGARVPI